MVVKDGEQEDALSVARKTIAQLREELEVHEQFVVDCTELLPPSYDADEAPESIILRFLKDMSEVGRIIAKLTADYR